MATAQTPGLSKLAIDPAKQPGRVGRAPTLDREAAQFLQPVHPAHLAAQKPLVLSAQRQHVGEEPGAQVMDGRRDDVATKALRPTRDGLRTTHRRGLRAGDDRFTHGHLIAVTRGEKIRQKGIRGTALRAVDPQHGNPLADAKQKLCPGRALTHRVASAQAKAMRTALRAEHEIPPIVWRLPDRRRRRRPSML